MQIFIRKLVERNKLYLYLSFWTEDRTCEGKCLIIIYYKNKMWHWSSFCSILYSLWTEGNQNGQKLVSANYNHQKMSKSVPTKTWRQVKSPLWVCANQAGHHGGGRGGGPLSMWILWGLNPGPSVCKAGVSYRRNSCYTMEAAILEEITPNTPDNNLDWLDWVHLKCLCSAWWVNLYFYSSKFLLSAVWQLLYLQGLVSQVLSYKSDPPWTSAVLEQDWALVS